MKNKLLKAFALFAAALLPVGAIAGEYCAPSSKNTCQVECCPDIGGSVTVGYDTDYILYCVHLARDNFWAGVNYTFDGLPLPLTVGVWHLTSLSSNNSFDETDVYVSTELSGFMGLTTRVGYIHKYFSNLRAPSPGQFGNSRGEIFLQLEKQLGCFGTIFYRRAYDLHAPAGLAPIGDNRVDEGAWVHTFGFDKDICLTDCVSLNFGGNIPYR